MREVYIAIAWALFYSTIVTTGIMGFYALGWKIYVTFFKQKNYSIELYVSDSSESQ